jgi:hypothetical protein
VACSKCDRLGRLSVAKLIEEHGADTRLPNLPEVLAVACRGFAPHRSTIGARCIIRSSSICRASKSSTDWTTAISIVVAAGAAPLVAVIAYRER